MFEIKITAYEGHDLRELYDLLEDGELNELATYDDISATKASKTIFGGGDRRLPELIIKFRKPLSDSAKAEYLARIRELVGKEAHIHLKG